MFSLVKTNNISQKNTQNKPKVYIKKGVDKYGNPFVFKKTMNHKQTKNKCGNPVDIRTYQATYSSMSPQLKQNSHMLSKPTLLRNKIKNLLSKKHFDIYKIEDLNKYNIKKTNLNNTTKKNNSTKKKTSSSTKNKRTDTTKKRRSINNKKTSNSTKKIKQTSSREKKNDKKVKKLEKSKKRHNKIIKKIKYKGKEYNVYEGKLGGHYIIYDEKIKYLKNNNK